MGKKTSVDQLETLSNFLDELNDKKRNIPSRASVKLLEFLKSSRTPIFELNDKTLDRLFQDIIIFQLDKTVYHSGPEGLFFNPGIAYSTNPSFVIFRVSKENDLSSPTIKGMFVKDSGYVSTLIKNIKKDYDEYRGGRRTSFAKGETVSEELLRLYKSDEMDLTEDDDLAPDTDLEDLKKLIKAKHFDEIEKNGYTQLFVQKYSELENLFTKTATKSDEGIEFISKNASMFLNRPDLLLVVLKTATLETLKGLGEDIYKLDSDIADADIETKTNVLTTMKDVFTDNDFVRILKKMPKMLEKGTEESNGIFLIKLIRCLKTPESIMHFVDLLEKHIKDLHETEIITHDDFADILGECVSNGVEQNLIINKFSSSIMETVITDFESFNILSSKLSSSYGVNIVEMVKSILNEADIISSAPTMSDETLKELKRELVKLNIQYDKLKWEHVDIKDVANAYTTKLTGEIGREEIKVTIVYKPTFDVWNIKFFSNKFPQGRLIAMMKK